MTDIRDAKFWERLIEKILKILGKGILGKRPDHKRHQHVVPHAEGWAVRGEGNERYTAIYDKQKKAIDRAKEIAQNYNSDVVIHGRNGRIRDRRSYD